MPGPQPMQGLHTHADDHPRLRVPLSVGEVHLPPHQTGEHWTLMVTPLQVRPQAIGNIMGCRGSRKKKQLAPARLDMPIFKSTDPGAEVTYTLWCFDVDAFLEQYDEASMRLHIFASLCGYPGKWACTLDEGKDISVQDLLMHMGKTFGNKHDYDAMIRTLYKVQQKEDETVEEYMLCIHNTVTVIHHAYPECLPDRGRDLKKDRIYHELCPYPHDDLSFAMAELPKREQACPTFDTLYTLVKKLEAGQPAQACCYATGTDAYCEKHRHYPASTGRVAALKEEGVVSANSTSGEDSESEVETVDGLNVHLAQMMSCYQREEWKCFMCGSPGHFARDCPHRDAFKRWHREQLNAKGAGENNLPALRMMNQQPEVSVQVTGQSRDPLVVVGGPAAHWIRPEMLVDLTVEGRDVNAFADSGSQVNAIMPTFVWQYGFPVLPLVDLVNHPLNFVGLGGKCTSPLRFIILHVQVREIARYDKDVVFLMVPDESEFGHRVPLVIGTCTIGMIINIIRESEIDRLSMSWAMARMAQLLSCQKSTVVFTPEDVGEAQSEGASGGPQEVDVDELVTVRESIRLGPFQTEIIEEWVKPLLGDTAHVMITPLKVGEGQPREARPLPPGLHILHMYTCLKNGSGRVSLMVRNMSDSHIFHKKGVPMAQVMLASPVPVTELSLEMEAALGTEAKP